MTTAFDSALSNLGITRTGASSTASSASTSSSSTGTLGQADFLKLMTAQMQNQDPFNPTDNTQMIAQMAQFSQLSGISEMNTTLQTIAAKLTGTSTSDAMSYVGKTVLTAGNTAYGSTSGGLNGAIELGDKASAVNVTISDPSTGATLKTIKLGAQDKGTVDYSWDGTTDSGEAAGSGPFKISAIASSSSGQTVSTKTLVWAPVTSVSNPTSGSPTLNVAGVGPSVAISDIRQIG